MSAPSADSNVGPYPFSDLVQAYYDCRRSKRNSDSALAFEMDLERNLIELHNDLTAGTYRPGRSICFVVTRPKAREVWAAAFRDRVVHHLLYNHVAPRFYASFIADSWLSGAKMNPYLIKGPAQIGLSGGRTSGHMVYKILDAHGGVLPPDVHLFFQNTGKEREETLVFIDQIAKRWNVKIVWMEWCRVYGQPDDAPWYKLVDFETASRNGEPFTMMLEYYAAYRKSEKNLPPVLPNFSNNMCTAYLKVKIGEKHMRALGYTEWDCVVGIRYDEPKRYHRMMAANDRGGTRWDNVCPSFTAGITKEDVGAFWAAQPFDLGMDSDFGNCDLCWKKNEGKLIKTIMDDPSRVIWWSGTEERFGQVFRQDRADYKTMGWSADQRSRQTDFDFDYLAEDIDCFCGD